MITEFKKGDIDCMWSRAISKWWSYDQPKCVGCNDSYSDLIKI